MSGERQQFRLAGMSRLFAGTSWLCVLAAVVAPVVLAVVAPRWLAVPMATLMGVVVCGVLLMVWAAYRPARFEVGPDGLRIVWPLRSRFIPAGRILRVDPVSKKDVGLLVRICGAGGFLGGFGWFYSRRVGHMSAYLSRYDGLVLVRLDNARPLLISPERPEEFVPAVRSLAGVAEA